MYNKHNWIEIMNVESKKGTQIDIFKAIGKVTILKADLKQ